VPPGPRLRRLCTGRQKVLTFKELMVTLTLHENAVEPFYLSENCPLI